jgi:exodeoxyribonuclease VII small subunit
MMADKENLEGQEARDPLGLETRLRRLEEIVSALEADEVELERALTLFEEGVTHVRQAERILARTELRVEELLGDGSAGVTRPLRVDSE